MFTFTIQLTVASREDFELLKAAVNKAEGVQIVEGPALDIARMSLLKCALASMRHPDETAAIAKEAFDSLCVKKES